MNSLDVSIVFLEYLVGRDTSVKCEGSKLVSGRHSVDICLVIKERLEQLGFEQKDLAAAAEVTESYVSQLLTRKKSPPAPDRTDIYEKMGKFLKMSSGKLTKLAEAQRREELKRNFQDPPTPLFREARELILRKCAPAQQQQMRETFEKQPFGELERFVTQKLLDVVKRVAREELDSDKWVPGGPTQRADLQADASHDP